MKTLTRTTLVFLASFYSVAAIAQDANATLRSLYEKYSDIPKYKVNIHYKAESEELGFKNEQDGVLTISGERYILKYGPNETWLGDGKAEYIGTKEEDHSELIIFCPGENFEAPVNYGSLLTFYGSGIKASMEGDLIKVVPNDGAYQHALIKASGNTIQEIEVIDETGMSHQYTISGFSTNVAGTQFTINPREYADTIDERQGCK